MKELVLLTKKELAEMLRITPRTVDRYVAANEIPCLRLPVSGRLRFNRDQIEKWLEANRKVVA